jgi:hypothetical protein
MQKQPVKVKIPAVLWKLHGRQAYRTDLVLTYLAALLVMIFCTVFIPAPPGWRMIVLVIISLDVGGGVISNFTQGTIDYYRESDLSPHAFIWLHLIQGMALALVYWQALWGILAVVGLTLTFASIVVSLRDTPFRPSTGLFAMVLLLLAVVALPALPVPGLVLLILLGLKLIVGFAGHWERGHHNNSF